MRVAVCVALACLLAAGCNGPPASVPEEPGTASGTSTPAPSLPAALVGAGDVEVSANNILRVVTRQNGTMGPEAVMWLSGPVQPDTTNTALDFPVGAEATGLVAELAWPDDLSDLDLHVQGRSCVDMTTPQFAQCEANQVFLDAPASGSWRDDDGVPGDGDGPIRIRLGAQDMNRAPCDRASCEWRAFAWAKATPGTTFELAMTVFYGEEPPADYHVLG